MSNKISNGIVTLIIFFVIICLTSKVSAQYYANNLIAQYNRNGYLWNPAYAGRKDHNQFYSALNNSMLGFEGAPVLVVLSGDMAFGKNSGGGLKFFSDKGGSFLRNTVTIDYSYDLKFTDKSHMAMGISAGLFSERITNTVNSLGQIDPIALGFNDRGTLVDGTFGLLYEIGKLSIAGVAYNLRTYVRDKSTITDANAPKGNLMLSYRFQFGNEGEIIIKPSVNCKFFELSESIYYFGSEFEYNKAFHISMGCNSLGSIIGEAGISFKKLGEVNLGYGSSNKYGFNQLWEIGIGLNLKK